ncbi:MAG: hypothetical protein A4E39_00393 [Methanoregulaceae archaeon PtaB.Bin152]|nr:MAG: hypothetical protein A4E39_00393 [Methanoregulaceae archaeon PtaB.Bin152]
MAELIDDEIIRKKKTFSPDKFLPPYTGHRRSLGSRTTRSQKTLIMRSQAHPSTLG